MQNRTRVFLFLVVSLVSNTNLHCDTVTDWNSAALDAIRILNTPPPAAARNLAILHVSIYDAVNSIRRTHEPYFVTGNVPASASIEAAAAAAAHQVLVTLYPSLKAQWDGTYQQGLASVPDDPHRRSGVKWGEYVASVVLNSRSTDGSAASVAFSG